MVVGTQAVQLDVVVVGNRAVQLEAVVVGSHAVQLETDGSQVAGWVVESQVAAAAGHKNYTLEVEEVRAVEIVGQEEVPIAVVEVVDIDLGGLQTVAVAAGPSLVLLGGFVEDNRIEVGHRGVDSSRT